MSPWDTAAAENDPIGAGPSGRGTPLEGTLRAPTFRAPTPVRGGALPPLIDGSASVPRMAQDAERQRERAARQADRAARRLEARAAGRAPASEGERTQTRGPKARPPRPEAPVTKEASRGAGRGPFGIIRGANAGSPSPRKGPGAGKVAPAPDHTLAASPLSPGGTARGPDVILIGRTEHDHRGRPPTRPPLAVDLRKFGLPSHDLADQAYCRLHPMARNMRDEYTYLPLDLPRSAISKRFGPGVGLYFLLLRRFSWILVTMFVISLPWVVASNGATYVDAATREVVRFSPPVGFLGFDGALSRLTLATLPQDFDRTPRENYAGLLVALPWLGGVTNGDVGPEFVEAKADTAAVITRGQLGLVVAFLDLVGWLIFACYFWYLGRFALTTADAESDRLSLTLPDYAVKLSGLPENCTTNEVYQFARRWGDVSEVQMVADDTGVIGEYTRFTDIVQRLGVKVAEHVWTRDRTDAVDDLVDKAYAIDARITARRERRDYRVLGAFVTYSTVDAKGECMEGLQVVGLWPRVARWFCPPAHATIRNQPIRATIPPSPDDIMYENLRFRPAGIVARRFVINLIAVALLALNVWAISALRDYATTLAAERAERTEIVYEDIGFQPEGATAEQRAAAAAEGCQLRLDICASQLGIENDALIYGVEAIDGLARGASSKDVVHALERCWPEASEEALSLKRLGTSRDGNGAVALPDCDGDGDVKVAGALETCYPCYCEGRLSNITWKTATLNEIVVLFSQCRPFLSNLGSQISLQVLASFFVVVMNSVLRIAMVRLVVLERHTTVTAKDSATLFKVAIAQYLNVAFTELLASSRVETVADAVADTPFRGILTGSFQDANRAWYVQVGVTMHLTLILLLLRAVVLRLAQRGIRWWKIRRATKKAVDQTQLDDAYTGPPFNMPVLMAETVVVVMVAVSFGASMPLLYLIAAAGCALLLWLDRRSLLRLCQTPARYGVDLAVTAVRMVLFASLVHLGAAAWMLGFFFNVPVWSYASANAQLAADLYNVTWGRIDVDRIWTPTEWAVYSSRLTQVHVFPFVLLGLLIVAWVIVIKPMWLVLYLSLVRGCLGEVCNCRVLCGAWFSCFHSHGNKKIGAWNSSPALGVAVRTQELLGPMTFAVTEQPRYRDAFKHAGKAAHRVGLGHLKSSANVRGLSLASRAMVAADLLKAQQMASLRATSLRQRARIDGAADGVNVDASFGYAGLVPRSVAAGIREERTRRIQLSTEKGLSPRAQRALERRASQIEADLEPHIDKGSPGSRSPGQAADIAALVTKSHGANGKADDDSASDLSDAPDPLFPQGNVELLPDADPAPRPQRLSVRALGDLEAGLGGGNDDLKGDGGYVPTTVVLGNEGREHNARVSRAEEIRRDTRAMVKAKAAARQREVDARDGSIGAAEAEAIIGRPSQDADRAGTSTADATAAWIAAQKDDYPNLPEPTQSPEPADSETVVARQGSVNLVLGGQGPRITSFQDRVAVDDEGQRVIADRAVLGGLADRAGRKASLAMDGRENWRDKSSGPTPPQPGTRRVSITGDTPPVSASGVIPSRRSSQRRGLLLESGGTGATPTGDREVAPGGILSAGQRARAQAHVARDEEKEAKRVENDHRHADALARDAARPARARRVDGINMTGGARTSQSEAQDVVAMASLAQESKTTREETEDV